MIDKSLISTINGEYFVQFYPCGHREPVSITEMKYIGNKTEDVINYLNECFPECPECGVEFKEMEIELNNQYQEFMNGNFEI